MNAPRSILILTSAMEQIDPALAHLTARGVATRHAEGAYRFVATFASEPAEVVILDLEGLDRKDLEILQVIREIRRDVGIVALVGMEQRALAAASLGEGAHIYLLKPLVANELLEAVDRAERLRQVREPEEAGEEACTESIRELALSVAHEVNNPLTTVSGWLQMLAEDRADDPQLAGVLGSLKQESDRIADAVSQLLLFAQEEPPSSEPTDVGRVIADMSQRHFRDCEERGIHLVTHIAHRLPQVQGNQEQIREACEAILADAEASMEDGGRIELTCQPEGGGISIVFSDNGKTLAPDALRRIFHPFQEGRTRNGNHIPLAVSYGIVRSHGGKLEAHSNEDLGTRFTLWLPSAQASEERE